ncbi:Hypp485 [Branchiostoma lanceolatum]|uniref:Hypp485 protein n=1 Tax=Branchiostoma lanceolatum TaxID=7740 RepID=A0A8J9W4A4_BRALA|nr:Hypp485 [Branchiostoma lanceolatum]
MKFAPLAGVFILSILCQTQSAPAELKASESDQEVSRPRNRRSILAVVIPIAVNLLQQGIEEYGRRKSQQLEQDQLEALRDIQRKLDVLDRKVDALQRGIGELRFGQQWLEGAVLYGNDIQRLEYFLDFLDRRLSPGSNGELVPTNLANEWADAVLSLDDDGAGQVLHNLHEMIIGSSGLFGRNSLFVLYESTLDGQSDQYWPKVRQFLDFTFSIQVAGYAAWVTSLNIKNRSLQEVADVIDTANTRIEEQRVFLLPYTKEWPRGSYGLPRTNTGCPVAANARWRDGLRHHDTEDDDNSNQWSSGIHFDGGYGGNMDQKFCMKTEASMGEGNWPAGNYCIFKKGNCPAGECFQWGKLKWDDEDDDNQNHASGVLPDGIYNRNTEIQYCCRGDGSATTPIVLPSRRPFYLFRFRTGCQRVADMSVRDEWFRWDDEDDDNANGYYGAYPYGNGGRNHRIHYCYYS